MNTANSLDDRVYINSYIYNDELVIVTLKINSKQTSSKVSN
jgi:hypothetical protein